MVIAMNERITENIVRDHFKCDPFFKNIKKIEEQKSNNPIIKQCLSTASKKGTDNVGFPEFIITFDELPDFIIIVECKASNTQHETTNRDKPIDYAVDGVLHYAKFLQKDFNVVAIAVSGQNKQDLKVSNFFLKKNQHSYEEQKAKQLLSIYDYIKVAKDEQNAVAIESLNITRTAIELNILFQSYALPEYERCTLVSAILLALQNDGFKKSYNEYSQLKRKNKNEEEEIIPNPKNLAEKIIDAVGTVLESNNIEIKRRDKILHEYRKILGYSLSINQKIKANKSKEEEKNNYVIRDIISSLEKEIYPLLRNGEKGYDVLGRFYNEFIRYAPSDKKTGLVLTPQHITEFFCDIAELSASSVVFDPCCGTGGFLVSAMKDMLSKSNTSEEKRNIKQNQLIGMEVRSDMFCFACTNMIMAGDGKSNIYQGNCFVEEDKQIIKNLKPNVVFLNPPYDIKEDEQLEFIENACNIIQPNGICVAIVQTSCVTSNDSKALFVREKLFKKHTLRAVFSMPNELFSPAANAVTCIIVFETGKPHDSNKKTFFGYFKDDGFVKQKNKGRIDINKTWGLIKEKWLSAYRNNDEIDGLSVKRAVSFNDELCAEAYMQTGYSKLTNESFILKIRNYLGFLFLSNLTSIVSDDSKNKEKIDFNYREWKSFEIGKVFDIERGKCKICNCKSGETPLVSSSEFNNGIKNYIGEITKPFEENSITVANNGSVGSAFYQSINFCATADVSVLTNKNLNKYNAMFIITIIENEKYRFNFGRKWGIERMNVSQIKLPAKLKTNPIGENDKYEPDWQFMENYIKSLPYSSSL